MSEVTTFQRWPEELRKKRGLLNGQRVQMAREARGMKRFILACKLGMKTQEMARREKDWCFWTEQEQALLSALLDFPLAFFVQDDAPVLAPAFICGHDEDGESWCEYVEAKE